MLKMLIGAVALTALSAGAAMAGEPGPRPPYATGVWLGLGVGDGSCGFTIAGAHGDVTLLGITLGGGAKVGFGGHCRDVAPPVVYDNGPAPAYPARQPYPAAYPQGGGYTYTSQGGGYVYSGGGYTGGGYGPQPYPQPAPCSYCQPQQPVVYRPY